MRCSSPLRSIRAIHSRKSRQLTPERSCAVSFDGATEGAGAKMLCSMQLAYPFSRRRAALRETGASLRLDAGSLDDLAELLDALPLQGGKLIRRVGDDDQV